MMTRVTWFVAGAAAGAIGASYTRRKVRRVADQITPINVARSVAGRARTRGQDVVDALREGRAAMRAKEAQLRADRHGDALAAGVAPAQIIVLSDVRQLEQLTRPAGSRREPVVSTDHPSTRRRRRSRR